MVAINAIVCMDLLLLGLNLIFCTERIGNKAGIQRKPTCWSLVKATNEQPRLREEKGDTRPWDVSGMRRPIDRVANRIGVAGCVGPAGGVDDAAGGRLRSR